MGYRVGFGYFGSANLQTSTANQEIIQQHKPSGWTIKFNAYKFSFLNNQDCHVIINESGNQIFVPASIGFEMCEVDAPIWSFVIVESGINYSYFGGNC